jgi:hypothetical protein
VLRSSRTVAPKSIQAIFKPQNGPRSDLVTISPRMVEPKASRNAGKRFNFVTQIGRMYVQSVRRWLLA